MRSVVSAVRLARILRQSEEAAADAVRERSQVFQARRQGPVPRLSRVARLWPVLRLPRAVPLLEAVVAAEAALRAQVEPQEPVQEAVVAALKEAVAVAAHPLQVDRRRVVAVVAVPLQILSRSNGRS